MRGGQVSDEDFYKQTATAIRENAEARRLAEECVCQRLEAIEETVLRLTALCQGLTEIEKSLEDLAKTTERLLLERE